MNRNRCPTSRVAIVLLVLGSFAHAAGPTPSSLQLPVCFTDNMVLQCGRPVAVWGDATPGSEITIAFAGQIAKTTADKSGRWLHNLEQMAANATPQVLQVASSLDRQEVALNNVLVGEVLLAGGQSNMAFASSGHRNSQTYIPKNDPLIRILHVPVTEFGPIDRRCTKWTICGPQSARHFSAVASFFATDLQRRLKIPVGIIGTYRGATWNENWMAPSRKAE